MDERRDNLVRACPSHHVVLEERKRGEVLWCPAGRHVVKRWHVVNTTKHRALYEATEKEGAKGMAEQKVAVAEHQPKTKVLDRAKFVDGAGGALFVRLVMERMKRTGDPFRLRWQQVPAGGVLGKKGTVGGVARATADEAAGRQHFKAAVLEAVKLGWKSVPIRLGGLRPLTFKPIPPPKKRAA